MLDSLRAGWLFVFYLHKDFKTNNVLTLIERHVCILFKFVFDFSARDTTTELILFLVQWPVEADYCIGFSFHSHT